MADQISQAIKTTPLSNCLIALESGRRPKGGATSDSGSIPSLGGEHLDAAGGFKLDSMKYIPRDYWRAMTTGLIQKHDILIVKDGATTGKTSFIDQLFPFERAAVNEHVFIVRVNPQIVYPRYAFYFLFSSYGNQQVMQDFRGSAQGGITRGFVERVKIYLPPLPVQKKITAILEKADQARRKRHDANRLTDQFLQAAFLEMFGDPVKNPKRWEVRKFGDYANFLTSGSRGWAKYYADSGAKFIRVQNLTYHKLNLDGVAFVKPPDSSETERTRVQPKDILISITGVVGLSAVVPQEIGEAYISQHVALARLKGNLNPMFAVFFISNRLGGQLQLNRVQYGQTKPGLNLDQIRSIRIYVPPRTDQEKFAILVERVEAFHEKQRQSEKELDTLFQSLMQKAFSGQLVA